jgi:hypothetical protein
VLKSNCHLIFPGAYSAAIVIREVTETIIHLRNRGYNSTISSAVRSSDALKSHVRYTLDVDNCSVEAQVSAQLKEASIFN